MSNAHDSHVILDKVFHFKTMKRIHPDIKDFRNEVAKRDHKLLDLINAAYETIHISMGYDGELSREVCQGGVRLANDIIDRCEVMLKKAA